ncbi:MAG TPA: hypothetical protein VGH59_07505 [Casimicrobiaceae bacterium]|jgi:hypothetical protein
MNKLLVALCASVFAFGSVSVLAGNDMKPISKMESQEAKAARAAAKAKWDKMTPEEQATWKKEARAKKRSDLTALEAVAQESDRYNTKQGAEAAAASKAGPAPAKGTLNTPAGNAALKKESSGQ